MTRRRTIAHRKLVSERLNGLVVENFNDLDPYYADKSDPESFADESGRTMGQWTTLHGEIDELARRGRADEITVDNFDHFATLLSEFELEPISEEPTVAEQRILDEDLVESVRSFPDPSMVRVVGAPQILVTLEEIGLHASNRLMVSEGRRPQSDWRIQAWS